MYIMDFKMTKTSEIAKFLINDHQNNIKYRNLPKSLKPKDINEAYLAQKEFQENCGRGKLGGFKIALASSVQQELCGIDHPIAGGIFESEIYDSPFEVDFASYHGLGLEFELAMEISEDLNSKSIKFDKNNVLDYISNIYSAFELIIDRDADYENIDALSMASDNVWCAGVILGNPIENWKNINFNTLKSTLYWNDETPQEAIIKDANPFDTLAWVINLRLSLNLNIPKGSKIITGSVIKTRSPKKGDVVTYNVGNLSETKIRLI